MDRIRSNGRPLICLEARQKANWGGVDRLTVEYPGATNDYDRACEDPADYATIVPMTCGEALVLGGELRAGTFVWTMPSGPPLIAQIIYAEPDMEAGTYLRALNSEIFRAPVASVDFTVASNDMLVFDSAVPGDETTPGDDTMFPTLSFRIEPGTYRVSAHTYGPDPLTAFSTRSIG